ncbi:MAG: glycosyl transferase [Sulfurimonas sp. RIFOXYD12_FULL_33_39]|uniref:MraY family glycosyltransferase n=1 Tax=unclassified Sulfurimonas TaxID=2623549 RepID=UPI0008AF65E5|nr:MULTISPECIES: glycosyltransferase family 4 protein [unclassified Sulfurimonas]OHE09010.1 MAG: glycosyl transferase [Sulfurimonas sp. RIFOXYD12_FULL_33_39]OHE14320.1 MAG: glycosyl transferase [Sulfurimonas sp. RIFOXYD2_FULL_34_21]
MIYLTLFALSFLLTYLIKNYALKKSFVADVNERSSHTLATPHGGGIAIAISWFVGLCYLYFYDEIEANLFYALMLGVVIAVLGFLDDLYELSARFRILVQSTVAVTALFILGGLESLNLGFILIENQIVTNLFAYLLIVWFINLYNFLDGIDGYAASEAVFLALAGFILFGSSHFLVLGAAVFGFLLWNWQRAKIFMGDVGSTLLGYTVAIFSIYYANELNTNLWIWITLFGVFWFDATFTLLKRVKNGENLAQAHKQHVYQRLTQDGWSHERVVIASMVINMLLFLLVYFMSNLFAAFTISLVLLYSIVKYVDR